MLLKTFFYLKKRFQTKKAAFRRPLREILAFCGDLGANSYKVSSVIKGNGLLACKGVKRVRRTAFHLNV
jgi:hypothetical protein